MARFALRRLGSAVLVLFAVSILTFLIFDVIPNGNPALRLAGRTATPANIAAVERIYGFDKPVYVQYARTMEQIFTGRIVSYATGVNVISQLKQALPVTASLVLGAAVLWLFFGILLGLLAGLHAGSTTDTAISALNFVGISAPSFVIGYVLIYLFSFKLHVFPSSGYVGLADPPGWAYHLAMPWASLAVLYTGIYSQVLRASVVDVLNEDFVRTARAKGLSRRRVILHHVLRTSLIPVVSLSGLDIAAVLGGSAIIIELVFDLPGIGYYASQSIGALDVPPVLVITLFGAFAVVIFSTIADVVYGLLDPRIRVAGSR
jgi:peptide/nickel transport system permease protein